MACGAAVWRPVVYADGMIREVTACGGTVTKARKDGRSQISQHQEGLPESGKQEEKGQEERRPGEEGQSSDHG